MTAQTPARRAESKAAAAQSQTQTSVADQDPNSIEAFAKRLVGSGFVVAERGKEGRPPTHQEAMLIAHAAKKYDLDPLMGEVSVLGSKLYVTLPGVRKSARREATAQGRRYSERTRPATREEYENAACGEREHYWLAEIIIDGGQDVFIGHGFASSENVAIATIWRDRQAVGVDARIVRNMAENRAVRRALVAAFGLPFSDPDEEREGAPSVPATTTTAPTTGQQAVYPSIPAAPASVAVPLPVAEEVAPEKVRTQAVTYPEPPLAAQLTAAEKAEIQRREREEYEREAAARDRRRGD